MSLMAIPLALMLLAILVELAWRHHADGNPVAWHEYAFNLGSGHLMLWFFRGVEVAAYAWVARHASVHWVTDWSPWLLWPFAFLAWDFCFYWMHRVHHMLPALWAVHVVHHQGETFNLALGVRNSWYSSLTDFPFVVVLAIIGVPVEVFFIVSTIHYSIQLNNHNSFIRHYGPLGKLLVTPGWHRVHHGQNAPYRDRNFGSALIIWDRLFGTFQAPVPGVPIRMGTQQGQGHHNPVIANHVPFLPRHGDSRHVSTHVATQCMPGWLIGIGATLLFMLLIAFIGAGEGGLATRHWVLFALIVVASAVLGNLSESRSLARRLAWLASTAGLTAIIAMASHPTTTVWQDGIHIALLGIGAMLIIHALATFMVPVTEHADTLG